MTYSVAELQLVEPRQSCSNIIRGLSKDSLGSLPVYMYIEVSTGTTIIKIKAVHSRQVSMGIFKDD